MKDFLQKAIFISLLQSVFVQGQAQISIVKAKSINKLVSGKFAGDSIQILNVHYKGDRRSIAEFYGDSAIIPMKGGIFLCSGISKNALGPNDNMAKSSNVHQKGDKELDKICKTQTHDAAILEFDFIPSCKYISFNFVFASEEYPEYAGSAFNDVFAFILTDHKGKKQNLAIVPKSRSRITVNTINHKKNAQYFINNAHLLQLSKIKPKIDTVFSKKGGLIYTIVISYNIDMAIKQEPKLNIQYDGLTKILQAKSGVVPGKKYHLKIAIADGSDNILDSGVFIEYGSFNSHAKSDYSYGAISQAPGYYMKYDTIEVKEYKEKELKPKKVVPKPIEIIEDCDFENEVVFFSHNSFVIGTEYYPLLDSIITMLKEQKNLKVNVNGYTDNKGDHGYNVKLSEKRAKAVSDYFIKNEISKERIRITGYGQDQDQQKKNPASHSKARRVDVQLFCPK